MADYLSINRKAWDRRAEAHAKSRFYNVPGFLKGDTSLKEIELKEMPEVNGQKLLHLQCHLGLDSLSWARKGAKVTGVDFSPVAIEEANRIKNEAKLDAEFVCQDIYEFDRSSSETYDIVFTSYGVLDWLPDLPAWANLIAKHLKPGGHFYIAEFHPIFDLISGYSYFHQEVADVEEDGGYVSEQNVTVEKMMTWSHSISDVLNTLIEAGIEIAHFNEFPFSPFKFYEGLEEKEQGRFYVKDKKHDVPLVYSILGTKR